MMRRKMQQTRGLSSGEILDNFSETQLALIGAIAMAYNEAETSLQNMVSHCLNFPGPSREVVSRINGTEGLVHIVMCALRHLKLPSETIEVFDNALNFEGFSQLKTLRDGVIHSRILDVATAIGRSPKRRGNIDEILLTPQALGGLFLKLQCLNYEMFDLALIIPAAKRLLNGPIEDDQHKLRLEQSIQEQTAQALACQNLRLSIPPSPKFPDEPIKLSFPDRTGNALLEPVLRELQRLAKPRPAKPKRRDKN